MRPSLIFSTLLLIAHFASAQSALNQTFSVNERNKSIESILLGLENGNVKFTYSSDLFDVKKRVTIQVSNASLDQILTQLFSGQNVEFMTMGNQVIIKKKTQIIDVDELEPSEKVTTPKQNAEMRSAAQESDQKVVGNLGSESGGFQESSRRGASLGEGSHISQEQERQNLTWAVVPQYTPGSSLNTASLAYRGRQRVPVKSHYINPNEGKKPKKVKEPKPQVDDPEPKNGPRFSGSVYTAMTSLNDDLGVYIGGRGLYYITPNLGIGFGGGGFVSPVIRDEILNGDYRISGGYGGVFVEYSFRPMKLLHMNYHALIAGGGSVYYREADFVVVDPNEATTPMFVLEPGVTLEVNVLPFFRMGFDATYRYTSKGELNYQDTGDLIYTTESLRGLNIGISLKFGRF